MNSHKFVLNIIILIVSNSLIAQPENNNGKLRLASSQFPVSSNIDSNAYWIKKHMIEASEKGANIIHFPECALSGYAGVDFKTYENFDWGKLKQQTAKIIGLSKKLNIWVVLGSMHQLSKSNKPHNSLYVINSDGEIIDRYDKRFCTNGDLDYYSPGNHFVEFELNGIKCGLLICYDVRFPELYREIKKSEVQLIFQSFYNARQKPGGIHPKIMPVTAQTRAATNHFYMSLTNSSAPNSWPCHFITPDGLIANKNEANVPALLISDINIGDKYYDASRKFRKDAIEGKLNSGQSVDDKRSRTRTIY